MRLFVCTDFEGHYPVGVAAITLAETEEEAISNLESKLAMYGLKQKLDKDNLNEVSMLHSTTIILADGNY